MGCPVHGDVLVEECIEQPGDVRLHAIGLVLGYVDEKTIALIMHHWFWGASVAALEREATCDEQGCYEKRSYTGILVHMINIHRYLL